MFDILGIVGAAVLAVLAAWRVGVSKGKKQGKQRVKDDLDEAYNNTTPEVQNAANNSPTNPDAVLDGLRSRGARGRKRSDT